MIYFQLKHDHPVRLSAAPSVHTWTYERKPTKATFLEAVVHAAWCAQGGVLFPETKQWCAVALVHGLVEVRVMPDDSWIVRSELTWDQVFEQCPGALQASGLTLEELYAGLQVQAALDRE